jgi:hypothetical protein
LTALAWLWLSSFAAALPALGAQTDPPAVEPAGPDEQVETDAADESLVKQAFAARARSGGKAAESLQPASPEPKKGQSEVDADPESQDPQPAGGDEAADSTKQASAADLPAAWWRRGKWEAELQYRYSDEREFAVDLESEAASSFDRDLSLHLGYSAEPLADWKLHLALNSGRNHRPLSAYVPLKDLEQERWLFFNEYWSHHEWSWGAYGRLEAQIGRYAYPFDLSQMLYDNDLQIPAVYLQYRHERPEPPRPADEDTQPCPQVGLTEWGLSLYAAQLCSAALPDQTLASASDGATRLGSLRLDTRWQLNTDARLDAAISYHDFGNTDTLGYRVAAGDWRASGNAGKGEITNYSGVTGALGSDFNLLDLYLSAQWGREARWPLNLELEAVQNLGATDLGRAEDCGWLAGFTLGRRDKPNAVQIGLSQARIESDAVLAAVNRGEYGTNTDNTRLQLRFTPRWPRGWKGQADLRAALTWSNDLNPAAPSGAFDKRLAQLYLTYSW